MESDLVISALQDIPTAKLADLVQQLLGEPDRTLQALRRCIRQELQFRDGAAPRPTRFELPGLTERELLVTGNTCVGAAEFLQDKHAVLLYVALARRCEEMVQALQCVAIGGPVN